MTLDGDVAAYEWPGAGPSSMVSQRSGSTGRAGSLRLLTGPLAGSLQPEAVSSACAATGTGTGTSSPRFPTGTGSCVDQASKVAHGMGMCASLDLGLVAVSSGCREASRCEYLG
jgi:hypothetical protein